MEPVEYDQRYRQLIKRFIAMILLLLSVVFTKQLITKQQTEIAANTSYVINTAGRQRMLSQKMVKNIILIDQDNLVVDKKSYQEDLETSFQTWTETHEELLGMSQEHALFQKKSMALKELFKEVEDSYSSLVNDIEIILVALESSLEDTAAFDAAIQEALDQETIYLEKMDQIVYKYEKKTIQSIHSIERTHRILFLLVLALVLLVIIGVVYPLFNYLKRAHEKVSESNKNLVKIIQLMKGSFFLTDLEGKILFKNEDADGLLADKHLAQEELNLMTSINWLDFDIGALIARANQTDSRIEGLETLIEDTEGNLLSVMISAFATNYNNKRVIVLNLFDFTVQKRAEELLKETAVRDELTGLYNRYILERIREKEFKKADLYDVPLSAILLDLDNFKAINDAYGHPIGDAILQLTADTIKANLRSSDYAIRIGGEEILIFMPNTDKKSAVIVAEKIRKKLEAIVHPEVGTVTASFGVAERKKQEEYLFLYKRVDKAVYEAKAAGKNCVKVL